VASASEVRGHELIRKDASLGVSDNGVDGAEPLFDMRDHAAPDPWIRRVATEMGRHIRDAGVCRQDRHQRIVGDQSRRHVAEDDAIAGDDDHPTGDRTGSHACPNTVTESA